MDQPPETRVDHVCGQLIWWVTKECGCFFGLPFGKFIPRSPVLAVESGGGHYFVGLDTTSHTCSVVTEMASGMKMMGEYDSKEAAEKAMADMKECKA